MTRSKRPLYGVVAASVADIEQREILSGVIAAAQAQGADTAVLSNIYNPNEEDPAVSQENTIYRLIDSDEFDGLILISEAILNPVLQQLIAEKLLAKKNLPIVVVGTDLEAFSYPNFRFINTSDVSDMADITAHLIEVHGFRDIDLLTGHDWLEASHLRVEGYRRALEARGIPFDESKVTFGDFWMPSGEALAREYLSGKRHMPQAVICANDYMAYGILDTLLQNDVKVPEEITVIGYEYIRERHFHAPLLTTYQRARRAVGEAAAEQLRIYRETGAFGAFEPPRGRLISGETCSCGCTRTLLSRELAAAQVHRNYGDKIFYSRLGEFLTECRSVSDFLRECRTSTYLLRGVQEAYVCLREDWYTNESTSESLICYPIMGREKPFSFQSRALSAVFTGSAAAYYFCPLFFSDRTFGMVVLRYDRPDAVDHILRSWLKSLSNGLEFLKMKNDIQYLTECQSLSDQRDTLTGMYNETGIRRVYQSVQDSQLYAAALKICLFGEELSDPERRRRIVAVQAAAEAVREFGGKQALTARIADDTFLCFVQSRADAGLLETVLTAGLCQHSGYMQVCGMDTFVCHAEECAGRSYSELADSCRRALEAGVQMLSERRRRHHYPALCRLRTEIYTRPEDTFDPDAFQEESEYSSGHLRALYRKTFGASFHQDCITARLARACHLLTVSAMSVNDIAEECGYRDGKYFLRQFQSVFGMTTNQFRDLMK